MYAKVEYENGHIEEALCAFPLYGANIIIVKTDTAIYAIPRKENKVYKYDPDNIIITPSTTGDCEIDDSNCWSIASSVKSIIINYHKDDEKGDVKK